MKKQMSVVLCLVLIFSLAACGTTRGIITHLYKQEYVVGQGNIKGDVDVSYFLERNERFEIGN